MSKSVILYFAALNTLTLLIMYADKRKSRAHAWRISESAIFTLSFLGGATGTLLGMELFRHKTKHVRFKFGIPLLMLANLFIYYLVLSYINVN